METTVHVRHDGGTSLTVGNGRTEVTTDWGPEEGTWMATELFLGGLASCMLATLVHFGMTNGIAVEGTTVEVSAGTVPKPVRFGTINVTYTFPPGLTQKEIDTLVRAGNRCKVHHTIAEHPEFAVKAVTAPETA
jgi:uncharacterized OsmC-like protein